LTCVIFAPCISVLWRGALSVGVFAGDLRIPGG